MTDLDQLQSGVAHSKTVGEQYDTRPEEIWVVTSSATASELVAKRNGCPTASPSCECVAIALDSLSFWASSLTEPLALLSGFGQSPWNGADRWETMRRIGRTIQEAVHHGLDPQAHVHYDLVANDMLFALASILLVGPIVLELAARSQARVYIEKTWPGCDVVTRFLRAAGRKVGHVAFGGLRMRGRSGLRLLGRTLVGTARSGLPRRLPSHSVLMMVSAPYYARNIDLGLISGLARHGIRVYSPEFGSLGNRVVAGLMGLPRVTSVCLLPTALELAKKRAYSPAIQGESFVDKTVAAWVPSYLLFAQMLLGGVLAAFKRMRPSAVVLNWQASAEGASLVVAAKALGIPTILLQGGAFTWADAYVRPSVDHYLVDGMRSAEQLADAGVHRSSIHPVGSLFRPGSNAARKTTPCERKGVVGVCSSGWYGVSCPEHWRCAAEIIRGLGSEGSIKVLVRPHPAGSPVDVAAIAAPFLRGMPWSMDCSPDIFSFLGKVDTVIHDASTVANDARAVGVPEVSTRPADWGRELENPDGTQELVTSGSEATKRALDFIVNLIVPH